MDKEGGPQEVCAEAPEKVQDPIQCPNPTGATLPSSQNVMLVLFSEPS